MESDPVESTACADRDATAAGAAAIGLEGAGPDRIDATEKVLLNSLGCDAGRVAATAAVCRARHADRDAPGWDGAAAVLEQMLQRLARRRRRGPRRAGGGAVRYPAPGGGVPGPEPEPFTWANRAAPERGWQRRVWVHARLRWQPPRHPGAHHLLLLRLAMVIVDKLDYQLCDQRRCGYVRELDVSDRYRGLGLGTRAIRRHRPDPVTGLGRTSPARQASRDSRFAPDRGPSDRPPGRQDRRHGSPLRVHPAD
jgi:hypothetical protein